MKKYRQYLQEKLGHIEKEVDKRIVRDEDGGIKVIHDVHSCPHYVDIMDFGTRGCNHPDSPNGLCVKDFEWRIPEWCPLPKA